MDHNINNLKSPNYNNNNINNASPESDNSPTKSSTNSTSSSKQHQQQLYQLPKGLMLSRGFSKVQANEEILNETRSKIKHKLLLCNELNNNENFNDNDSAASSSSHEEANGAPNGEQSLPDYSFMLPDLNKIEDYKFKEYLNNDLIEMPAQYALTESGHLNWWCQGNWENVCRQLYPMVTSGDGNCLLHAASLAMWGLHDRYLILRKALHSTLEQIKENASPLWRRWKWEQMCQNRKYGLIYNDEEWSKEWNSLLKLSSYQPRVSNITSSSSSSSNNTMTTNNNSTKQQINGSASMPRISHSKINPTTRNSQQLPLGDEKDFGGGNQQQDQNKDGTVYFESLEEFHVFLLAHILQRPIIIVADTMLHDSDGEPLSPIPFGGIYLPLECDVSKCHRYPLVLAYDSAHFSALVLMDELEDDANNEQDDVNNSFVDVDKINKKLQLQWPFAIVPITYSNIRDVLPIHFAYDPGSNYDWSQFPYQATLPAENGSVKNGDNNLQSNENMTNGSSDGVKVKKSSSNENSSKQIEIELTRDQKLFLLQKYLDIVKLQLYEPGPAASVVKRNANNIPTNSSGMRVNITNVRVPEPSISQQSSTLSKLVNSSSASTMLNKKFSTSNGDSSSKTMKNLKQNATKTVKSVQKFFSIFKKASLTSSSNNTPILLNSKPINQTSESLSVATSSAQQLNQTTTTSNVSTSTNSIQKPNSQSTIFHKLVTYKSWNSLFDSTNHYICLLGVKLNLAKPPKFNKIISNYIVASLQKFELIKQQQILANKQQQQQHMYNKSKQHYCVVNISDCLPGNLCNHCNLSYTQSQAKIVSSTNNNVNNNNNNNNIIANDSSNVQDVSNEEELANMYGNNLNRNQEKQELKDNINKNLIKVISYH